MGARGLRPRWTAVTTFRFAPPQGCFRGGPGGPGWPRSGSAPSAPPEASPRRAAPAPACALTTGLRLDRRHLGRDRHHRLRRPRSRARHPRRGPPDPRSPRVRGALCSSRRFSGHPPGPGPVAGGASAPPGGRPAGDRGRCGHGLGALRRLRALGVLEPDVEFGSLSAVGAVAIVAAR